MKQLGKWSVEHRISVNLLMVFLLVAGLYTVLSMKREVFPQFSLDMIHIGVEYPAASPEEVEEGVCIKIEEQLKGLEDIKTIYSTAKESYGSVTLELKANTNINEKLDDVRTEIGLIDTFPDDTKKPVITEIKNNDPSIYLAVFGDVNEKQLRVTAEKIRDDLVEDENISLVSLLGTKDYEISIEISEESLRRFNISFDQLVYAVKTGSLNMPGGKIKTKNKEFLVRTKGKFYTGEEFENLSIVTKKDGTSVKLKEIAGVIDKFEDQDIEARFNGKPAVLVVIRRTDAQDTIAISKAVKDYIKANQNNLPKGIKLSYWFDLSEMVQDRIDLLLKNGLQGVLLVFIVLALFLDLGLAFWVASGIPISFMGAFLVLKALGASINMISLFGFIMTLGILVDDAIIVGENVYTHYKAGKSPKQAVLDSMAQIGAPVVMAVLTTIVAFTPLLYLGGIMGKFISIMPKTVICILALSLVEALIILPAHLEHSLQVLEKRKDNSLQKSVSKFKDLLKSIIFFRWLKKDIIDSHAFINGKVEKGLDFFIYEIYTPVLKYCVKNRYFTLAIGFAILIVSIGVTVGGHVPFVFFPKTDSNWIVAEIVYPLGTSFEKTKKTAKQIEQGAFKLNDFFKDKVSNQKNIIVNNFSQLGVIARRDWKPGVYGGHCAEIWIEIQPSTKRPGLSASDVTNKWRELTGDVLGIEQLTFSIISGGPGGNPIEIQLRGEDFNSLQLAAEQLKKEIAKYPGTFDIIDTFKPGKTEKQLSIKQEARSLDVTMADIATQIRQAYYGEQALQIQRNKDDVKVMVRYSKKERESEASIDNLRIRTKDKKQIPLNQVANIKTKQGYSTIQRVDRKRLITIISNIDENIANAAQIVADLKVNYLNDLVSRFPGISYDLEGQAKRTEESLANLKTGFLFAAMIIFLLLASQFQSYIQPVIIMTAIPFGFIGALLGHLIMGLNLTMMSIFGIVALSGIVVNDSLILIDFINKKIKEGQKQEDSVIESGQNRFRPVLLTSITTIAGLFPLLLETSFQAQFLIPMAVSISFGLLAATVLILVFVPSLYLVIKDLTGVFND